MDPSRRRKVRLVVALSCALLLAVALIYTSFSASSEARQPSQLVTAQPGKTYQLTGKVAKGSWQHHGIVHDFKVEDRKGGGVAVAVRYVGSVPDPFREGREIVIDVRRERSGERSGDERAARGRKAAGRGRSDAFIGQPDTLVTKCPSKFSAEPPKT